MTTLDVKAYTPSRQDGAVLEARTVGREQLLDSLARRFAQAGETKSRQHTLLVGPRGSGKSHGLEVALHRLSANPTLASAFRIARLPEDAVGISSASDVLLQTLIALDPSRQVLATARAARGRRDLLALEHAVESEVGDHVLAVVVENLDRVFNAIGLAGQSDLRAWVETSANVLVLATAPLLFQAVQSRDAPWYGSFAIEHLEGLSVAEGATLLQTIGRQMGDDALADFVATTPGRSRLEAIHHLAGGSPRIWTIFASCVSIESLDLVVPAVEMLLEELVPYYQQRLWELPANEQKLVHELAIGAPTATVADLATSSGLDPKVAATTMGRLEVSGWVRRNKMPGTDQRTTWYELREPLLRHHLRYRDNRGEDLRLIVDILLGWFDRDEKCHGRSHIVTDRQTEESMVERARARVNAGLANQIVAADLPLAATDLLRLVALEGDATAFARLPAELRSLLTR